MLSSLPDASFEEGGMGEGYMQDSLEAAAPRVSERDKMLWRTQLMSCVQRQSSAILIRQHWGWGQQSRRKQTKLKSQ